MPAPADARTEHALDGAIVLLDVDGTLVDSAPAITFCLARAIEAVGLEAPPVEVLGADIGPPLEDALAAHGVPDEAMGIARNTYRRCYSEVGLDRSRLYPGVADTLAAMCSAGARLATATSKRVAMATEVCAHLGIVDSFEVIGGAGDLDRLHKPEILAWTLARLGGPVAGRTAMVGDRHFDVAGGLAHGLPSVGVTWGYGTEAELHQAGAAAVVDRPRDLPGVLGVMLGG
ncbi:MAG: HAD hydrolase-like protein [Microthrixaceae bacterium]